MNEEAKSGHLELPWLIALFVLMLLAAVTLWYPVLRTFANIEINYNEGWNAYRAQMAASGVPLYAAPPKYTVTNYPPLSFHFIGFLGRVSGDFVAAGRYLSLVSLVLIALLVAATVRRFAGHWQAGSYAAFSFLVWLALYSPDRVGMNDPQLFATVFSLLGVYLYVARPDSRLWLGASAILFALSVFTKHNLLAFPLAVGAHLLLTRAFQRFAIWSGVFAAAAILLLLVTLRLDGPYFLAHLTAPRPYSILDLLSVVSDYFRTFQLPVAAAVLWSLWNYANPARNFLVIALVIAHLIAFAFSGGYGVDRNIFFDAFIVLVMILGVAAAGLAAMVQNRRFGNLLFTALLLTPMLGVVPLLPFRIYRDIQDFRALPAQEDRFAQAVAFLAARPGPALCGDPLLCFEAGKPEEFTTYFVSCQLGTGKLTDAEVSNLIGADHFNSIELSMGDRGVSPPGRSMRGFTRQVVQRYHVALRSGEYGILIPGVNSP